MRRILSPAVPILLVSIATATGAGCYGLPGCRVNLDCSSGQYCQQGSCQPSPLRQCSGDSNCNSGEVCINSVCQPDCVAQGCTQGDRCDSNSHQCVTIVFVNTNGGGTTGGTTTGGTTSGGTTTSGTSTGGPPPPFCSSCATGSCGPVTSVCMQDARGFEFCGTDCTDGQACPTGAQCISTNKFNPQTGQTIFNCFPDSFLCWCSPNSDTWSNYADGFFTSNCQTCHSQYPTQLTQFTSFQNVQNASSNIQAQIGYEYMPLQHTLTQDERARILNWLDCGLPQ
jgi:hypothetical protein